MAAIDLSNLLAYTAQGVLLAILATTAHALLRLHAPAVSYVYWRCALGACLFAPLLLVRPDAATAPAPRQIASTVAGSVAAGSSDAIAAAAPRAAVDWPVLVIAILGAGIVLRLVWLARSFARLGALRRSGRPAGAGESYEGMQRTLGTRAEIRFVPDLAMPVTFGIRHPVVLLPAAICDRAENIRSAIVAHELVHVQRRDWLWHLAEEAICALLWFSPAVWWLVSRVHLSREAAVDATAVKITGKRRSYLEALISFADDGGAAPMPAFARRRHLFLRIQSLSREAVMSSKRVVLSSGVLAFVLVAGTLAAATAFPITSSAAPAMQQTTPGPLEQRAKAVTTGEIPRRTDYVAAEYPTEARAIGAGGAVTMRITLDELGRPAEVRPLTFAFTLLDPPANGGFSYASQADMEAYLRKRMTTQQAAAMLSALNAFAAAAERAVQQWRYEAPASGPVSFNVSLAFKPDGEVTSSQRGAAGATASASASFQSASGLAPIRVGGNIRTPTKIADVRPVYPEVAKAARVSGLVIIEALIGTDGTVEDARVLRSIPLLDQAALDAVRQWRFTPTMLNGVPVPVIMTVTVNFTADAGGMGGAGAGVSGAVVARRTNVPRVVYEVKPQYTPEAMRAKVEGTVVTEVTIGTDGSVTDARVVQGIPLLDAQALAAVRQWRFDPPAQPVTTTIELTFRVR